MAIRMGSEQWRQIYGPWVVVTGASDGIGRAMAEQLAGAGLNLVIVARRRDVLQQLAADLMERHNIDTRVIIADLTGDNAAQDIIAATADLDVGLLVASAGFGTSGRFIDAALEDELNMLAVNCRAVLTMSHAFGRRFAQRGRGGIILMSSLLAFQGVPLSAHYAATKAYVQSLAEGLHIELAPLGVDVLVSAPGPTQSSFAQRANMQMGMALRPETVARGTLNALGRRMTTRPGWLSKFLEISLSALPRTGRVRVMQRVMVGMTQHQHRGLPESQNGST